MAKKDDEKKDRPVHGGSVSAEDEGLMLWLDSLWHRSEFPERIELWQLLAGGARGEMLHHEDFQAGKKRDIEDATRLSNELIAVAQHDCDTHERKRKYLIVVIDKNRKASPLTRGLGPLQPKRSFAMKKVGTDVDSDDGDEEVLNEKVLSLRYIKEAFEQNKWDKSRNDRIIEGMVLLQDNIIKNQQSTIDRMFERVTQFFDRAQEAEDRRVQRDILLEREKFKFGLMKDGWRAARNLLPSLFAAAGGGETTEEAASGTTQMTTTSPKYGPSTERALVENFLNDCEESGLSVALFGDFEERDGKAVQVKEGIFAIKQFGTLVDVSRGTLPPAALDDLMPKSGHELEVTMDQIRKATEAGMTEGTITALLEIIALRSKAKEARAAAPAAAAAQQESTVP